MTGRREKEAGRPLIVAINLDAFDRTTKFLLEPARDGINLPSEVDARKVSPASQTSRNFKSRQRTKVGLARNLKKPIRARGFRECPVFVCDPQPVRDPQMPVYVARKFCHGHALEKVRRAIPQTRQASTRAVARAARPMLNFHLCLRTTATAVCLGLPASRSAQRAAALRDAIAGAPDRVDRACFWRRCPPP